MIDPAYLAYARLVFEPQDHKERMNGERKERGKEEERMEEGAGKGKRRE